MSADSHNITLTFTRQEMIEYLENHGYHIIQEDRLFTNEDDDTQFTKKVDVIKDSINSEDEVSPAWPHDYREHQMILPTIFAKVFRKQLLITSCKSCSCNGNIV